MPAPIANAPLPVPVRQVVRRCLRLVYARACTRLRDRAVDIECVAYYKRVRHCWAQVHQSRMKFALHESQALEAAGVDNPDWHHHLAIVMSVSWFLAQEA